MDTTLGILWLFSALLCAGLAHERRRNVVAYFLLGLILGPIGVAIALLAPRPRLCPHCREAIRPEATACPHCQRDVGSG